MPDAPITNPEQYIQCAPILRVPDVPATASFYRDVLGFTLDAGAASPDYTVVWRDNAAIHLVRGEPAPSGVRIFFWVRDVNAIHDDLVRRGVRIDVPIETRAYGVRDFSIHDPNGVMLVLGQDRV